jgi:small subunit ribosomal protein S2
MWVVADRSIWSGLRGNSCNPERSTLMIDFRELVRLGAHFGHIKRRLHPKMNRYIWGVKNNVHLFDVSKTARLIDSAAKFLESVAAQQKTILWVGTKKPARDAIFEVAQKLNMPYVNHRWIGGTLSNFSQVRKSVTKLLHYEDILAKAAENPYYTKKELNSFSKMVDRLKKNIGGIINLTWPIGAIVLVDVIKEGAALREAVTVGVPIVALVDTNSDPSLVNHVIPINDDSARVIKLVIDYLGDAVVKGQKIAQQEAKKKKEEQEAKRPKLKAEGAAKPTEEKKAAKKTTTKKTAAKPAAKKSAAPQKTAVKKEVVKEKKEVVAKKKTAVKPVQKAEVKKEKAEDKKTAAEKKKETKSSAK